MTRANGGIVSGLCGRTAFLTAVSVLLPLLFAARTASGESTPEFLREAKVGELIELPVQPIVQKCWDGTEIFWMECGGPGLVWRMVGAEPRGELFYPVWGPPQEPLEPPATFYIEPVAPSQGGYRQLFWFHGTFPEPYSVYYVWVLVGDLALDLDIDSDNDNGFGLPDRSQAEEDIEDIAGDPASPGKRLIVNDGDVDADGIPDFADGFDLDPENPADDLISNAKEPFVPVVLELTGPMLQSEDHPGGQPATITFIYSASNPALVTCVGGVYQLPAGCLRLWTKDAAAARKKNSVADPIDPGDFIPTGVAIDAAALGLTAENPKLVLYLEAVAPSEGPGSLEIKATCHFASTDTSPLAYSDTVRACAVCIPPPPTVDLDIDSDNANGLERSDAEDEIEDAAGSAERPGKIIQVNDGDADSDGIPDFADGYNLDPENPDSAACPGASFVPLVLELRDAPWDLDGFADKATLTFAYLASDPALVTRADGVYKLPTAGSLRVWTQDGKSPRTKEPPAGPPAPGEPGRFIPAATPIALSALGFDANHTSITLYVEAVHESEGFGDLRIAVTLKPNLPGPVQPTSADAVRLTAIPRAKIDLVIDSKSELGFAVPGPSEDLEAIEDLPGDADHPGKIIQVNDGDADADGIPDFADGYNLDPENPDSAASPNASFVPLVLDIRNARWDIGGFADEATVTFAYPASDPALVACTDGVYQLPTGSLRIWTKDASSPRSKDTPAAPPGGGEPGRFVPAGTAIPVSFLGLDPTNPSVALYVEAVAESADFADLRIAVTLDPGGSGPGQAVSTDAVRLTAIRLEFVVPAEYDEATGLPLPNAAPVPTTLIGVSDPRPTVALDPLTPPEGFTPSGGYSAVRLFSDHAEITLSGTVKDPIADNVPRGTVSAGLADIDSVAVTVDGQAFGQPIPVQGGDDAARKGFWCQHPYKGTFPATRVNIPLTEGTHIVRLETSKNAAGNTGFAEVAVTLSKQPIPVDLEGQDPATIKLPPTGPVTETRGLWHFEPAAPGQQVFAPPSAPFGPGGSAYLLYHLEEPDAAADSCGWNPGTLYGSPATLQPGRFGYAIAFDGCDDFIQPSYGFDPGSSEFTLEGWVCPANGNGWQTLFSNSNGQNGFCLRLESGSAVFRCYTSYPWGEYAVYGQSVPPGVWSHIAVVRRGDLLNLYVNGVDGWGTVDLPPWSYLYQGYAPFRIGAGDNWGCPADFFQGSIDEIRISGAAHYAPAPVVVPDASNHGSDATLKGTAELDGGGQSGGCLRLGASSDYAEVPASPSLLLGPYDFALEGWLQAGAYATGYLLAGPGYSLYLDSNGYINCSLWGDSYAGWTSNSTLYPGTWTHVCLVRTGETVTLLLNGTPDSSVSYAGSLSPYPATVTVGYFYPGYDPQTYLYTGPIYVDEVSVTVTIPPPPLPPADTLHASILFPPDFDPADPAATIHYFCGTRDATLADPAFTQTAPNSLVFHGSFQGIETTIAIDPARFSGLTPNIDSFLALVTHSHLDGSKMDLNGTFTETEPTSKVFRAGAWSGIDGPPKQPGSIPEWCKLAKVAPTARGSYFPCTVRVQGLPGPANLAVAVEGAAIELTGGPDGCLYLKGGSFNDIAVVRKGKDGPLEMAFFRDDLKVGFTPFTAKVTAKAGSKTVEGLKEVAEAGISVLEGDISYTKAMRIDTRGPFLYPSYYDCHDRGGPPLGWRSFIAFSLTLRSLSAERIKYLRVQVRDMERPGNPVVFEQDFTESVKETAGKGSPEPKDIQGSTFNGLTSSCRDKDGRETPTTDADGLPNVVDGEEKFIDPGGPKAPSPLFGKRTQGDLSRYNPFASRKYSASLSLKFKGTLRSLLGDMPKDVDILWQPPTTFEARARHVSVNMVEYFGAVVSWLYAGIKEQRTEDPESNLPVISWQNKAPGATAHSLLDAYKCITPRGSLMCVAHGGGDYTGGLISGQPKDPKDVWTFYDGGDWYGVIELASTANPAADGFYAGFSAKGRAVGTAVPPGFPWTVYDLGEVPRAHQVILYLKGCFTAHKSGPLDESVSPAEALHDVLNYRCSSATVLGCWGVYEWKKGEDKIKRVAGDDRGGTGPQNSPTGDCAPDKYPASLNDGPKATDPDTDEKNWIVIPAKK